MRNPDFRPLTRETGAEPFTVLSSDWNSIVRFFEKTQGLVAGGERDNLNLLHPWKVNIRWEVDLERWVISLYPGFVRGIPPRITTTEYLAGARARRRLDLPEEVGIDATNKVSALITEIPAIAINEWRPVVDSFVVAGKSSKKREVPESIQERYGIYRPSEREVITDPSSGIQTVSVDISDEIEQDRDLACLLYCIDVVLIQPRPTVELAPPTVAASDFRFLELQVRYARPETEPPRVELSMLAPVEQEVSYAFSIKDALDGLDNGFDVCPLATIWMVGPPGELDLDKVDFAWRPVVEYHTFFNLDYTVNAYVNSVPPFRQRNPADGLLSGVVVQSLVELMNAYNREVEAIAQRVKINGKFWTV